MRYTITALLATVAVVAADALKPDPNITNNAICEEFVGLRLTPGRTVQSHVDMYNCAAELMYHSTTLARTRSSRVYEFPPACQRAGHSGSVRLPIAVSIGTTEKITDKVRQIRKAEACNKEKFDLWEQDKWVRKLPSDANQAKDSVAIDTPADRDCLLTRLEERNNQRLAEADDDRCLLSLFNSNKSTRAWDLEGCKKTASMRRHMRQANQARSAQEPLHNSSPPEPRTAQGDHNNQTETISNTSSAVAHAHEKRNEDSIRNRGIRGFCEHKKWSRKLLNLYFSHYHPDRVIKSLCNCHMARPHGRFWGRSEICVGEFGVERAWREQDHRDERNDGSLDTYPLFAEFFPLLGWEGYEEDDLPLWLEMEKAKDAPTIQEKLAWAEGHGFKPHFDDGSRQLIGGFGGQ